MIAARDLDGAMLDFRCHRSSSVALPLLHVVFGTGSEVVAFP